MQRAWRSWLFGTVALVCGLFCLPCFARQSGGRFRVTGVVVSANTGAPLVQARVTIVDTKNRREGVSMITQEDGRFEFTGLSAGKYSLHGAKRGYIPAAYEQHEQYSTAIVTGEEFDTQNLTLRLVPMAAITGKVLDENGEGVRDAQVKLYVESHRAGATRVMTVSSAMTDDQGAFEFMPLGAGKYYVSASAVPWYAVHMSYSAKLAGGSPAGDVDRSLDVVYPTTFSGGSTESQGAEAITVKGGDHAQVDIRLSPVQALHLVFHVAERGEHEMPLPVLRKHVFDTLEYVPIGGSQGPSSSPGVVEISGLPPGRYSLRLPGNGPGQMEQGAEVELKQDGQDLDDWKGEPLGRVKLSVKIPKEEVLPKQINIGLQDAQNTIVAFNQVDRNGEVKFESLSPGRYAIRVFVPAKAYSVARMTSGDTQVSGHEFTLTAGETREWTVLLAEGKTNIEGFVKRAGKAASGVMVVLVPKEIEAHQYMFRRDQSDLDGSFVLRDVIPGTYSVVAIEDAWGFDWSKPNLLARYAEHGQALTIGELMQGAVHLPDPVEVQPR